MNPFKPDNAATVNIDVSSSSQRVQIEATDGTIQVRIFNNGTATVWVEYGGSGVTASLTTSFPVGPGMCEVLSMKSTDGTPLNIAAIAAAATGKIYFTPGDGE